MLAKQRAITAVAIMLLSLCLSLAVMSSSASAATVNATLRPITTISNTQWTEQGTADSSCSGACDYIDESVSDGVASYLNGAAAQGPTATFAIGGGLDSGQTATSIVVHAIGAAGSGGLGYPPVTISLTINGSTVAAPTVNFNSTTYQDRTATFTGSWTKSQVDAATVTIAKAVNGLQPAVRLSTLYVEVTYTRPLIAQTASRFYANANSVIPGAPLASTNTVTEVSKDVPFRLRLGMTPTESDWSTGSWGIHGNTYYLEYSELTAASCAAQVSGWQQVSSGGAIRWYDNASVANGATISDLGTSDVSVSGTRVPQRYHDVYGPEMAATITSGNTGIWDFSLVSSGQPAGRSFCFRILKGDVTTLDAYTAYPQIVLTGDLGVTIVDAGGTEVTSPVVPFSSTITTTKQCNTTTATLGVSSQRIRVTNALVTNGWNVSIAAANPTSLWTAGASYYDFNDVSGCSDGGDGDAWGGRLTVNPSGATVTPTGSCTMTGVSKGSSAAFTEGTTNAITLLSATSGSQRFCDWDMTSVGLSQQVPSQTAPGSYSLDMVITATAQ
ncbi:MAG TPA: hypothetical protein VGE34_01735 [Candidatus Saccharimonadales bacterium]